jgi:hypothetical protein
VDDMDRRIEENREKLIALAKEKGLSEQELERALFFYELHTLTYYKKLVFQEGFDRGYAQAQEEERKRILHGMRDCGMTADEIVDVVLIDM